MNASSRSAATSKTSGAGVAAPTSSAADFEVAALTTELVTEAPGVAAYATGRTFTFDVTCATRTATRSTSTARARDRFGAGRLRDRAGRRLECAPRHLRLRVGRRHRREADARLVDHGGLRLLDPVRLDVERQCPAVGPPPRGRVADLHPPLGRNGGVTVLAGADRRVTETDAKGALRTRPTVAGETVDGPSVDLLSLPAGPTRALVQNDMPGVLPFTGGTSTVWLLGWGAALAAAGPVVLIVRHRGRKTEG